MHAMRHVPNESEHEVKRRFRIDDAGKLAFHDDRQEFWSICCNCAQIDPESAAAALRSAYADLQVVKHGATSMDEEISAAVDKLKELIALRTAVRHRLDESQQSYVEMARPLVNPPMYAPW